jgi:putative hydrolase of the HAD superfamily
VVESRIAAVSLDAGNTLLYCDPPPPAIYAEHLSRYGPAVSAEAVAPAFRGAWTEMQQATASGDDRYGSDVGDEKEWWGRFIRVVLRQLDHPAPWRPLLEDLYLAFSRPEIWNVFPDTVPTLEALRRAGIPLAVTSNWDRRLSAILDDLRLTPYFAAITISSLEGVEKPSLEIFRRTASRLGVTAGEILHVGDSPRDDYEGAAAAGLEPRLLDRHGVFAGDSYRRIESLAELPGIVSSRGR